MKDVFGDRMKGYEKIAQQSFIPLLPVCIRLDGRCFSKWTHDLARPFDTGMMSLMCALTKALVAETNAVIGYTQSDEISLILYSDNIKTQLYFDGKIQKIVSSAASFTTAWFNTNTNMYMGNTKIANFDCRAWQVPNLAEAANVLLWREQDATKNSVSMAARSVFSHKELHNCNSSTMQDMLMSKGINWNEIPFFVKKLIVINK